MTADPTTQSPRRLTRGQGIVLGAAFVPMVATGLFGAYGTFSNISHTYGKGTATGAVAAGEGATAVLALVLLGLTMLGQSSPWPVRAGLWALPAAASAMSAMAAPDPGRTVIYALTPMGMSVSAEGAAFLARRIVVHRDGRDPEAERKTAALVQALAYHRARAANHPDAKVQAQSERESWRLAEKVGVGDVTLGARLVEVQRERVTEGADAALAAMFGTPVTPAVTPAGTDTAKAPALPPVTPSRDGDDTQVNALSPTPDGERVEYRDGPVTPPVDEPAESGPEPEEEEVHLPAVTLADVAMVAGVTLPEPGATLTDAQLLVVLRFLRHSQNPPLSYRQAAAEFRRRGFKGAEDRVREAWTALMARESTS
ncbi:hypothetical protein [Streptomyces jeddahensis]|uniref:Conjugal transfer protein n=1 Tax=Streptomyces jeddahensis TaxID=1716141 RepID=A0A177HLL7_9ACTN|nr:hypothetical protein [Streptomyces jeddahensis]OAH11317.1 hypothetical protein STSP_52650 [Streptomyces jeddahensis]